MTTLCTLIELTGTRNGSAAAIEADDAGNISTGMKGSLSGTGPIDYTHQ
jgi:hypothetical protein